jgi:hypothetical protein
MAAGGAKSAALRARRPIVSSVGASAIAPRVETAPNVGFHAVTPQAWAGMRTEPPVSEPSAKVAAPLATATADPDDDPPVMKSACHGLRDRACAVL